MKRPLLWGLVASLALNLFLLGFVAARHLREHGDLDRRPTGAFRLDRALRDSELTELRQTMRKRMAEQRPARMELRRARHEVRSALEAEPFERARLEAVLSDLRARSLEVQQGMHQVFVDVAQDLTPEQRRRLADANWRGRPFGKVDRPE